jgi:hypothetical protein
MTLGPFEIIIILVVAVCVIVSFLCKAPKVAIGILLGFLGLVLLCLVVFVIRSQGRPVEITRYGEQVEIVPEYQRHPIDDVSPIWLPGVEDQFEADVYPSRQSAERALGLRTKDQTGVNLNTVVLETHPVRWPDGSESQLSSGRVEATVTGNNQQAAITANFVEKPWVENFADFVNRNPKDKWILALSQESCVSQAEAEQQAMSNVCGQVAHLLNQMPRQRFGAKGEITVTSADIRNNSFIADKFAQSFDGTAGRIWRQAILINASQDKLAALASQKKIAHQSWRTTWIRELVSVVGMAILICVVYLFLNMATRGYYTWSLRIAAVVLLLAGIWVVFILS